MRTNDKNFIGYAVAECNKKHITVIFDHKKFVTADNTRCSGYFDDNKKKLIVACQKPQKDFFPVFVHEFCHFQQWVEKDPVYTKVSKGTALDYDVWEWLSGKDTPMERVEKSILAYQKLELDCEKRVIQHVDNFKLSIKKKDYIQTANLYVLFYSLLKETRKWYKTPPYQVKEIVDTMPTTFIESFEIPRKCKQLLLEKCF